MLQIVGEALQIEQRNSAMNYFIGGLIEKMRAADIYTLLVKGQGIAQCYEKPRWRACGDVDFYLSEVNYNKAIKFLRPLANHVDDEDKERLHQALVIDPWTIELHGTMHSYLSKRINKVLDEVHNSIFYEGNVRSWMNDSVQVFLPEANDDVIIVFTHIIDHFYGEGIGLRQVCDWCRLLWKYNDVINRKVLEARLQNMGLMSEWKVFASFAIEYLGMPEEAVPFCDLTSSNRRKAGKLCKLILDAGNLGHNKDNRYRKNYSGIIKHAITFFRRLEEFLQISYLFPWNSIKFFVTYSYNRIRATV